MAKQPQPDLVPIVRLTAVEWRCPFCGVGNAVPETVVCACGAVRDGNHAAAPAQPDTAAAAEKAVATPDDDKD